MQSIDKENLVRIVEKNDSPLFLPNGERFVYAKVPEGTRVLFPRKPLPGVPSALSVNCDMLKYGWPFPGLLLMFSGPPR